MFIICPKCGAKYQIPQGTTLENGQKLKCSACGHLFVKGEEAPMVLDKVIPAEQETTMPAFSKPLYTMDDMPKKKDTPIPEVFQPLPESTPKKTGLWIIPVYIILLVALCVAGWKFRDLLKPSFSEILPDSENKPTRTITLPKTHQDPLPLVERALPTKPVAQPGPAVKKAVIPPSPVVEVKPQQNTIVAPVVPSVPKKAEVNPSIQTPKEEVKPIQPTPEPTTEITPSANFVPTPISKSDEVVKPIQPEIIPEPILDDNQPLFELGSPVVPASIQITDVDYRVEPNDTGILQLLVNGNLKNLKPEIQSAPILKLFVYDSANQLLAQKEIHLTAEMLAPSEIVPFYTSLLPAPPTAARVEVRPQEAP